MLVAELLMAAAAAASPAVASPSPAPMQIPMTMPAAVDADKPVPLFDDLGTYHRAISTKNPTAQKYFDQGLRLAYGFNHDEAERAFREAAHLDPSCGICWWGVALVLGPNINLPIDADRDKKALEAVGNAKAAAPAAGVERALIDAVAVRYSNDPAADRAKLDKAYADAMGAARKKFPADDDVATLYAESLMDLRPWKFWSTDGKAEPGTEEIVSTLETVLKRNPNHPGANHYYIHAVEASQNPRRASASAKRLETLVPGAGHLVHMPAHIYMRTGNYAGASEANTKAAEVDEKYIGKNNVQGVYPLMYYTHNLQFLAASAAMEGRSKVAIEAAKKTTEIATAAAKDVPMAEFVVPWHMYFLLRFHKWPEVLALPKPDDTLPTAVALWHFGRGVALASQRNVVGARAEKAQFVETAAKVPADAMMSLNTSKDLLNVAALMLDAEILEGLGGDTDQTVPAWRKVVEAEDKLSYDEPPAWYYPTRESLGVALTLDGRPEVVKEAVTVFQEDLQRNPGNARSLFGLAEAYKHLKKEDLAAKALADFKKAWAKADCPIGIHGK
jgi:tetratricopeptide (TPR) repeat protein